MSISSLFDQLSADAIGIEWPRALTGETATIFSTLFDLERTERLPPDALARLQAVQLDRLLRHASAQVPFYADRLKAAGYRAGKTAAAEIWPAIPILTRSDIQEAGDRLRAKSFPKSHGAVQERSTSGSTSRPVRIATTQYTSFLWTCANMRDRLWHDIDLGGTLVLLTDGARKMGRQPFVELGSWSLEAASLRRAGKQFKVNPSLQIGDLVRTIRKIHPAYIQTRPSQLNLLIKQCETSGERFAGLRAIFCLSEIVTDTLRQACRDILGAPIIDCYSCAEMGYLALQCPEAGHLHVQSEMVHVEILRADGQPCASGETGRVVATSLHNYAMPLIRYEIGDEAEVGAACACGRGLPVIQKVLGRTQDYLKLRSGQLVRADTHHYAIARIAPIIEFQIVQRSLERLEIRLVARRPLDEGRDRAAQSHPCAAGRGDVRGRCHPLRVDRAAGLGQVPTVPLRGRLTSSPRACAGRRSNETRGAMPPS